MKYSLLDREVRLIMPQADPVCAGLLMPVVSQQRFATGVYKSVNLLLHVQRETIVPLRRVRMATHRSRRLRKKLFVDEFQELGFELSFQYKEGLGDDAIDAFIKRFAIIVESNDLVFSGCDEYGLVCLARRGSVSPEQREMIAGWLRQQPELAGFNVSPLIDAWYPDQPVNPPAPEA